MREIKRHGKKQEHRREKWEREVKEEEEGKKECT